MTKIRTVRQHAIAALSLTQKAKQLAVERGDADQSANNALIDGVRKFAMDVRELDIDLIDRGQHTIRGL